MNRLTETKLEREMRISFAYIDHITNEACKKLDLLKKDYEPKVTFLDLSYSALMSFRNDASAQQIAGAQNAQMHKGNFGCLQNSQAPYGYRNVPLPSFY